MMSSDAEIYEISASRERIKEQYERFIGRKIIFILFCVALTVLVAGVSATLGSYEITVPDVYAIIWKGLLEFASKLHISYDDNKEMIIVWNLRLPRITMAIIAGFGLAVAGTIMQGILRNPLASPYTLGIASGAGFGAALAILMGVGFITMGEYLIIGNAFLFSLIPTFVILALTRYKGATPETMILAGIAMSYIFSAATTLMEYFADPEAVKEVVFWMVGDLDKAKWGNILPTFSIVVFCFIPLMLKSWDMNLLSAGDETAKSLGVDVERTRILLLIIASLMTSVIICFTGTIGFIGLVAPHMCRMVIGGDNRFLIPASGIFGGALLLSADTIARRIIAPVILPVGVITSFMGGPLFLYLIMRRRSEYW